MLIFLAILGGIFLLFVLAVVVGRLYEKYTLGPRSFKGGLKPLEIALFKELETRLTNGGGEVVSHQARNINRGKRSYFHKRYLLELYGNSSYIELLFTRKDSFKLATLSFVFASEKYNVEFKAYDGSIVEMTVKPSCKKILWTNKPVITKFRLANDPMEALDLKVIPDSRTIT